MGFPLTEDELRIASPTEPAQPEKPPERCPECGGPLPPGPSLWGRCKPCENARLGVAASG